MMVNYYFINLHLVILRRRNVEKSYSNWNNNREASELAFNDKMTFNDEALVTLNKNKGFNHAGKISEEVVMANANTNHNQLTYENKHDDSPALCVTEIDSVAFDFQDCNADENDEFSELPEVNWEN